MPRLPEFGRDTAFFGNLANSHTVTVSTTVGNSILGSPFVEIDPTALIGSPTLSISDSLTADFIYFISAGDPATSVTVEIGGSLHAPLYLAIAGGDETGEIIGGREPAAPRGDRARAKVWCPVHRFHQEPVGVVRAAT